MTLRKMHKYFQLLLGCLSLLLASCVDMAVEQPIDEFVVQITMPEGFKDNVKFANKTVYLQSNRIVYTSVSNSEGVAVFLNIIPDIYSISTSWEMDGNTHITLADTVVENLSVVLSCNLSNEKVFESKTITLAALKAVKQSLIISKIYGSGTKDNNNKNYLADRYIEIFNNSDETQYIDSTFYLGIVEGHSDIPFPASANQGYVYARQLFRFSKTDKKFAVSPGNSVVITSSAIDHTQFSPYSINLRDADFEAKNVTFSNNSNIKELIVSYTTFAGIPYLNLVNGGDNGIFLLRTTENVSQFLVTFMPGREVGDRYMRIPIKYVFDGVEVLKNKSITGPNVAAKRLQPFVDATYTFISASSGYTHESLERRVDISKSSTSRYYLIDTNNSLNDFRVVTDPTPRKYDKPLLIAN